ncbi:FAD-dependent monooxygenase [Chlorogloeopsis sp. ULAP01]|uniref:FAD-dependent oxidoreductase n=1 Tax=Chlorogloeopsis sp. ULAP01 TaxID=3056483 RepID=UPI0025AB38E4|nr:FAD-dependent monooxygenase [Chlorogloeopsis sp. ULAP01]MDM9380181.1 FAD-dependent monooxygenase [Chlorogloeopsis sp. ULAP01]
MTNQQNLNNGSHALVIGSSMAGLLAARVLVNHFDRVTVVERDRLPQQPELRPGVPQANQVHVLLTQGQRLLEQLFPGLEAELAAAGAPKVNWTVDYPLLGIWGWFPRVDSDLVTHTCSRSLLEWLVRRRLSTYHNLQFLDETQVTGLLSDNSNSKVTGIKLRCRNLSEPTELTAHLIVDASGRNSSLPKWLADLGYPSPQETIINSFLGYGSRWYECPDTFQADWKVLTVMYKPPYEQRGGVIYPVEGKRWVITVAGIGRDYPPTDEAGFLEFVRSLRSPILYEAIKNAKPLSPVYGYRRTENLWRHYEQLPRMPEGLVALGDAVCSFNPIYGQGMTTATLGALTLEHCLKEQRLTNLTRCFHKQLARVLETPWMMATSEDFRWETTEGGKPDIITRLMHRYMDQVILQAVNDPKVYRKFAEVIHMVKPPSVLFAPDILVKVLAQIIKVQPNKVSNAGEVTTPPPQPIELV